MKNIENLVTDLETSKALQEAGIKYDTAFVWVQSYLTKEWELTENSPQFRRPIPAFTAGDIMQVLPDRIERNGEEYFLKISKLTYKTAFYEVMYISSEDKANPFFSENSFHQALSKLCLWCRKEGYL